MIKIVAIFSFCLSSAIGIAQMMTTTSYRDTTIDYIELNPGYNNFVYPIKSDVFGLSSYTPPTDGVYSLSTYGHRYLSNTTNKTDNHGGFDYWKDHEYQGIIYDDSNKVAIICMCDGVISDVIEDADSVLDLTATGRSVQVLCNTPSQAFGGDVKINYRHLSALGPLASAAHTAPSNSIAISMGDTIGLMGQSGTTTNVHLHLSTQVDHPINGSAFVHTARLFNPTAHPDVLGVLRHASIELLHTWNDTALFRVIWPHNQTINRFEFINNAFSFVFDKEAAYDVGSATRDNHDCLPGIKVFAYQYNGKQTALSRYTAEKANMPAIYPASPQRDLDLATYIYPHYPITHDSVSFVYDFVVSDLPQGFTNDDFLVKLSDVWGYTIEGNFGLTSIKGPGQQTACKVYPNPTKDNITIAYGRINGLKIVEVRNVSGSVIKSIQTYDAMSSLNVLEFPVGLYSITIRSDQGVETHKMIKE